MSAFFHEEPLTGFHEEPPTGDPLGVRPTSNVPILVVDDNAGKRLAVKAVLEPLGHPIVEAESGIDALRCLMVQDFAVILLDVRMPGMDGFETAALIRQREQSEMTPIIFFTGYAREDLEGTDNYAEGAVDFIFAPVQPNELRAKVTFFANSFVKAEELAARARDVQIQADQLTFLADSAPIGIFQVDAQRRYVYTNERWAEITGIPAADALGQVWHIDASWALLSAPGVEPGGDDTGQPELGQRFEMQIPGAAPRIVVVTSKVIPDGDDGIAGWIGTISDVTAEVEAEAALSSARDDANEASRLKSDFLANMSHEIRTPMNGVIGMTDLLLETDLDPRQRDYAQTVRNSGEALLTIINDILDFSKIEAGKLDIEDIEFSVGTIVDDVADLLGRPAQHKDLDLVAVIESSVPALVTGDPGRVRQVLTNLIGNAIKFTQTGEIVVRVTGEGADADGDTVIRFEVTDTGDGIATDKLALIFHPFVQADTSTSRRYGGTGLGLAISGQLVALMGGDCGVTSKLGEGSSFWFTIRARVDATQSAHHLMPRVRASDDSDSDAPIAPEWDGKREIGRLLLAEDNLINQKVAVAMLSSAGYRVDTVPDGAAAVRAVALHTYDAILMDCQMPELNGYEATAAIRAQEGSGRHTPVIAMTAGARREDRERCLAEGMDGYLSKPVSKDALLALVARSMKANGTAAGDPPSVEVASAEEITIDPTVFDELRVLGESTAQELISELIDQFVVETEALLIELRAAVEAGDVVEVARLAHSIKGVSGQMGGRRLASSCDRLEGRATTDSLSDDQTDLQEIEVDYEELCRTLVQQVAT